MKGEGEEEKKTCPLVALFISSRRSRSIDPGCFLLLLSSRLENPDGSLDDTSASMPPSGSSDDGKSRRRERCRWGERCQSDEEAIAVAAVAPTSTPTTSASPSSSSSFAPRPARHHRPPRHGSSSLDLPCLYTSCLRGGNSSSKNSSSSSSRGSNSSVISNSQPPVSNFVLASRAVRRRPAPAARARLPAPQPRVRRKAVRRDARVSGAQAAPRGRRG